MNKPRSLFLSRYFIGITPEPPHPHLDREIYTVAEDVTGKFPIRTASPDGWHTDREQIEYLWYEYGFSIFPLLDGGIYYFIRGNRGNTGETKEITAKMPRVKWEKYMTTPPTEEEVQTWLDTFPQANYAIACGKVSDLCVIDCDSDAAIAWAERNLVYTPVQVQTRRGIQYYYRVPQDEVEWKRESAYLSRLHIDLLSTGKYVVAPGSLHPDGATVYKLSFAETVYNWQDDVPQLAMCDDFEDKNISFLLWPAKCTNGLSKKNEITLRKSTHKFGSGKSSTLTQSKKIDAYVDPKTGLIPCGRRNTAICSFVGGLIARGVPHDDIVAQAKAMAETKCEQPPSDPIKPATVESIVESLFRKEQRDHPIRYRHNYSGGVFKDGLYISEEEIRLAEKSYYEYEADIEEENTENLIYNILDGDRFQQFMDSLSSFDITPLDSEFSFSEYDNEEEKLQKIIGDILDGSLDPQFENHKSNKTDVVINEYKAWQDDTSWLKRSDIPYPYAVNNDGLFVYIRKKIEDEYELIPSYLAPEIHIEGRIRAHYSNENTSWGSYYTWADEDFHIHSGILYDADTLHKKDFVDRLKSFAEKGYRIPIDKGGYNIGYLLEFFSKVKSQQKLLLVEKTGLTAREIKDDAGAIIDHSLAFTLPTTTIYSDNFPEKIICTTKFHNTYSSRGTLEDWQGSVARLARGNSRAMFAIAFSFASALIGVSNLQAGGFHLVGSRGGGKTTIICAAASVWGFGAVEGKRAKPGPHPCYVQTWRSTTNGLEAFGASHNETLGCLDEITEAEKGVVEAGVYTLANGIGKQRLTKDSEQKPQMRWKTFILSTGEKSVEEKIQIDGGRIQGGLTDRLASMYAPVSTESGNCFENLHEYSDSKQFADALSLSSQEYYGTPILSYVQHIVENAHDIITSINDDISDLANTLADKDKIIKFGRIFSRFSIALYAGYKAIDWGILPWEKDELYNAIKKCIDALFYLQGGYETTDTIRIIERANLLVSRDINRFVEAVDLKANEELGEKYVSAPTLIYGYKIYSELNGQNYVNLYIAPEVFKNDIFNEYNLRIVTQVLSKQGILRRKNEKNILSKPPKSIPLRTCYRLVFKLNTAN